MKIYGTQRSRLVSIFGLITGIMMIPSMQPKAQPPVYSVKVSWGSSPWYQVGDWIIGGRTTKNVIQANLSSTNAGKTLSGTITYEGEGPIGFRGTLITNNQYSTEVQWGGSSAPWHKEGNWVIGNRTSKNIVALNVSQKNGKLTGTTRYNTEGNIGFRATLNPPGSPIAKVELGFNGYEVPADFNVVPPTIPTSQSALSAFNSGSASSQYHTKLARYAWRLFIAANNGTAATLSQASTRETPVASFLTTGSSPLYNSGNNPLIFEGFYHRTEAYPYFASTRPPSQADQTPIYRFQDGFTVTDGNYVNLDESNQISQNMLYNLGGNDTNFPVLYMAKVNRTELDYVYTNLPPSLPNSNTNIFKPNKNQSWIFTDGVVEIKAAWRRVRDFANPTDATKYHQAIGTYYVGEEGTTHPQTTNDTFALIALHIIQKTKNYPEFIFSSFEHVDVDITDKPEFQLLYNQLAYDAGAPTTATVFGAYSNNVPGLAPKANQTTSITLPPAGFAPGNFVDGTYNEIVQPQTITREVNDVNNEVHDLFVNSGSKSIWQNYRLKGVQSIPTSQEATRDFYLANIVVETSRPGVQLFKGGVQNPAPTVVTNSGVVTTNYLFTNNRISNTASNISRGLQFNKKVPTPFALMGGCMGCHGQAQQNGRDFSFLASGAYGKGKSVDSVPSESLSPTQKAMHNLILGARKDDY